MGHEIPVSFGVIDRSQLPETFEHWYDALPLLEASLIKLPADRFYEAWSRNWFDLYIVESMSKEHGIQGLSFLKMEIACVCGDTLEEARTAIDRLIDVILNGTSSSNANPLYDASWNLLPENRRLLEAEHHPVDSRRKAEDNFFAFLRLLRRAIREAIQQSRCLLFVAPQS